jgi:hypothetical protein
MTKMRWQFSVLVRTSRGGRRNETWWNRIQSVFGIRAVVGHTAVGFLEDDRLLMPLSYIEDDTFSCISHNTRISHLNSIITNGLAPGGDGVTTAVHSQLSAFHAMDRRLQESSRASTSDAIILYNVSKTKPLLSVAVSGVLTTRRRIPGSFIERIWIKRATPLTLHNGKRVMRNRWVTLLDSRSRNLPFTGWTGVQKSGYSDVFKDMMRRLRHPNGNITFAIVIREAAAKHGYGSLSIK